MKTPKNPMQPIMLVDGCPRFKENAIVRQLDKREAREGTNHAT